MALGNKSAAVLPVISVSNSALNAAVLVFLNKVLSTQSADQFFLIFGLTLGAVSLFNQNVSYNFANFVSEHCTNRSRTRAFVIELLLGSAFFGVVIWALLSFFYFASSDFDFCQTLLVLGYILSVLSLTVLYTAYSFLTEKYLVGQLALFGVIVAHTVLLYSFFFLVSVSVVEFFLFFMTYSIAAFAASCLLGLGIFREKHVAQIRPQRFFRYQLSGILVGVMLLIFSVSPFVDAFFIDQLDDGVYATHAMSLRIVIAVTSVFVSAFGAYYSNSLVLRPESLEKGRRVLHFIFFAVGVASVLAVFGLSNIALFEEFLTFMKLDKVALTYNLMSVFPMLSFSFLVRDEINAKRWSRMGLSLLTFVLLYPSFILLFEDLGVPFSISIAHSASWLSALLVFYCSYRVGSGREWLKK